MSPEKLPGSEAVWPEAALLWLRQLGCDEEEALTVLESAPPFSPSTLKQVFTGVMDLGRRAGRLGETMALLGHQEAAFRQLRESIGIPRAAPPAALVPSLVLLHSADGWQIPGGWIPDLLDRAAGRSLGVSSGDVPRPFPQENPFDSDPKVVFIIGSPPDDGALPFVEVCPVRTAEDWLVPGPGLMHAVFEAASRMHCTPDLFLQRS